MNRYFLACLLSLVAVNASGAPFLTGLRLQEGLEACERWIAGNPRQDDYFHCGLARGVVMGAVDAYDAMIFSYNQTSHMCLNEGVDYTQLDQIVGKWLKEHPEDLHLSGADLAIDAIIEAFPCDDSE